MLSRADLVVSRQTRAVMNQPGMMIALAEYDTRSVETSPAQTND